VALQDFSDAAAIPAGERRVGLDILDLGAQTVSLFASPPVLIVAALLAVAARDGDPATYLQALGFAVVGILAPLFCLWRQVRTGQVADLEVTERAERIWPLILATTCLGAGCGLIQLVGAPQALVGLACVLGVQTGLVLLVTMRWKISVHGLAAATTGVLLWSLWRTAVPLAILVPAVAWSRLHLRRHTVLQVVAGSGLGAGVFALLWPLLGG